MEGRVELLVNGMWSAVCDDDWDNVEATIVCKTLSTFPFDRYNHSNESYSTHIYLHFEFKNKTSYIISWLLKITVERNNDD